MSVEFNSHIEQIQMCITMNATDVGKLSYKVSVTKAWWCKIYKLYTLSTSTKVMLIFFLCPSRKQNNNV